MYSSTNLLNNQLELMQFWTQTNEKYIYISKSKNELQNLFGKDIGNEIHKLKNSLSELNLVQTDIITSLYNIRLYIKNLKQ